MRRAATRRTTATDGVTVVGPAVLSNAPPSPVGTSAAGVSTGVSRADHVHAHGNQAGGSLHAQATALVDGFISAADKTKLDGIASGATNTALSNGVPANTGAAVGVPGVSTNASRSDHAHQVNTLAPTIGIGGGNLVGSSTSLSRSDHGHALRETSGPTDLTIGSVADGKVLVRSGATIVGTTIPIPATLDVDFGTVQANSTTTTISVPGLTTSRVVMASMSAVQPAGVGTGEQELEPLSISCAVVSNGVLSVTASALSSGVFNGIRRIVYITS